VQSLETLDTYPSHEGRRLADFVRAVQRSAGNKPASAGNQASR
jgi:hypothetical protein